MIKNELSLKQKTQQALVLTLAMQQALHILQLPTPELVQWLQVQIEQNPALQFDETDPEEYQELDFEAEGFEVLKHLDESFVEAVFPEETLPQEHQAAIRPSLYDHLMDQARATFKSPQELEHAEQIIGSLDSKGFLGPLTVDPHILRVVQTFDPPGVGARTVQECLLIQLRELGKGESLSYQLIESHFDDLLRFRFVEIAKAIQSTPSTIQSILKREISSLNFNPGSQFEPVRAAMVIPDIIIEYQSGEWVVTINDSPLPRFTIAPLSPSLAHFHSSAKWIETILKRRGEILKKIGLYLLEKQTGFFQGIVQTIKPLSLKQMSQELGLNESTISRAVKEKYLHCPRGVFPLKHFFPHNATRGVDSSHTDAKKLIKQLIEQEDKNRPLSDLALARAMAKAGIPCARRTVTKYRQSLKIPRTALRKKYRNQATTQS